MTAANAIPIYFAYGALIGLQGFATTLLAFTITHTKALAPMIQVEVAAAAECLVIVAVDVAISGLAATPYAATALLTGALAMTTLFGMLANVACKRLCASASAN